MSQGFSYLRSMYLIYRGQPHTHCIQSAVTLTHEAYQPKCTRARVRKNVCSLAQLTLYTYREHIFYAKHLQMKIKM